MKRTTRSRKELRQAYRQAIKSGSLTDSLLIRASDIAGERRMYPNEKVIVDLAYVLQHELLVEYALETGQGVSMSVLLQASKGLCLTVDK